MGGNQVDDVLGLLYCPVCGATSSGFGPALVVDQTSSVQNVDPSIAIASWLLSPRP